MLDWNPQLYLKFRNERTQPSIDLVNRIQLQHPKRIIDIGCGPGNSAQILLNRWPKSDIIGLDNSIKMIEQANKDYPEQKWILGDASTLNTENKFDIVFSNATLQWIPNHETLIPNLFNLVNDGGVLAVQIPRFENMPLHTAIQNTAKTERWKIYTKNCEERFTFHDYKFYYDLLAKISNRIEMWETSYIHIIDSHIALIEWIRSTGLKPYLENIPTKEERLLFENDLLVECKKYYQLQRNSKLLFSFIRLFFIAYKI